MGIQNVVGIIECRQEAPAPVYLRVVLIDLRNQEEERRYEERECEGGYEGIGG